MNDWLAGNWLMLWTMAALSVVCGAFFVVAVVANDNNVACFEALATWLSMGGYTVGSLYWTAASYPPSEPSTGSTDQSATCAVPPAADVEQGPTPAATTTDAASPLQQQASQRVTLTAPPPTTMRTPLL